jgi:hypothetical protein
VWKAKSFWAEKVMETMDRMDQDPLLLRDHDRPAADKVYLLDLAVWAVGTATMMYYCSRIRPYQS